jgi:hypothetical protein
VSVGDYVEVQVDLGGTAREYRITARGHGRRVEVQQTNRSVVVSELRKNNEVVRRATFLPARVIALVEHFQDAPAKEEEPVADQPSLALDAS